MVIEMQECEEIIKKALNVGCSSLLVSEARAPLIVCIIGGEFTQILSQMLKDDLMPFYPTPKRAVQAIGALIHRNVSLVNLEKGVDKNRICPK